MDFLMVVMASGIVHGCIHMTTTVMAVEQLRQMAAILQLHAA